MRSFIHRPEVTAQSCRSVCLRSRLERASLHSSTAKARVMYTVLRVLGEPDIESDLGQIMAAINLAGSLTAERRQRGDGLVVTISTSPLWEDHLDSLRMFLDACGGAIARATKLGASPTLDVAIEPEDQDSSDRLVLVVYFDPKLLATLSAIGVRVEVTSYNGETQSPRT